MKNNDHESEEKITMHETIMSDACILGVKVGTTGFRGGDAGHGGRTVVELTDMTRGGDIDFEVLDGGSRLRCELRGDAELRIFKKALEFALAVLKAKIAEDSLGLSPKVTRGDVL